MTKNSEIDSKTGLAPWWHPVHLEVDQCWHFAVGPLFIYLQRRDGEWLLAWENQTEDPGRYEMISEAIAGLPEGLTSSRYVFNKSPVGFHLTPKLLDRPLVVKTTQPVKVPPGEEIVFYISSPVCVDVELIQPTLLLQQLHTVRLSDTWFGPSTQIGELCYSAKTRARNSKVELPLWAHRAVTTVTVHNRSASLLAIEKLSIPLPFLAVYGLADGTLWTDPVFLEHSDSSALSTLKIGKDLPAGASVDNRLAAARTPLQRGSLVRVFSSFFSG